MAAEKKLGRLAGDQLAWGILGGLVVAHLILAILLFDPKPFIGGDNAGYMILAESLETGQGYRNIHLPGSPWHAQYPPFYPAVLATVRALGGGLIAFKILSVVFTSASLVFLFLLGRRRLSREGTLAVVAPFALSPVLLYYSHWVLSEALFVLLTLIALWASECINDSRRWVALSAIFGILAYLTRAAGLPFLVALLLILGLKRRWRQLGAVGGASAAGVAAGWLWGKLAVADSAQVYSKNFLLVDPYRPELGHVGLGELVSRVVNNIRLYSVEVLPESLAGPASAGGINLIALLVGFLLIALALVAWIRDVRKLRVLELFTAFYLGLLLLWPQIWTDRRFLLPLLPAILLHAVAGVVWSMDFVRLKRPVWVLPALGALLILLTIPDHVRTVSFSRRCRSFYRQGDQLACYPAQWRSFAQSAYWVRENTPDEVIVVNRKPRLFYYFSGRRGDVYPFTTDDREMLTFLDDVGADYVLVAPVSQTTYRYLVPVIQSVPERFELAHQVGEGSARSYVLRYRGGPAPSAGPVIEN